MTLKMRSGVRSGTHKSLFIGPGAVYKNFKSPANLGEMLGATKGGSKVSINQEWHNSEIDGTLGPVKGARWLIGETCELETNLLEMSKENLQLQLPGSVIQSDSEYDVLMQTDDISSVDYYDVAIVGELVGKKKPIIFLVRNAVATEPLEVDTGNGKDDVVLKVKFQGNYTEENPTTPPYAIYYPIEDSDTGVTPEGKWDPFAGGGTDATAIANAKVAVVKASVEGISFTEDTTKNEAANVADLQALVDAANTDADVTATAKVDSVGHKYVVEISASGATTVTVDKGAVTTVIV